MSTISRGLRRIWGFLFLRSRNRLTPGVRAEVVIVLSEDTGRITLYFGKLDPEENPSEIYGAMLMRFLAGLSSLGCTLNFETEEGVVIPLVRPAKQEGAK